MTLSIRRSKQKTINFGYSEPTNFKFIESPSLILAKKQNKLEEEVFKRKLARIEKEASKSLIKLSKNIYETNIELNGINYELKRNKLETIYKNYNFCSAYRNNKNAIKKNEVDEDKNEEQNKNPESLKEQQHEIIQQRAPGDNNNNNNNNKEEKLNKFLTDLSTKSEIEINYMLAVTATNTPTVLRPKTVASSVYRNNSDNNRSCSSASSLSRKKLTVESSKLIKDDINNNNKNKNKAFNEINIEAKTLKKDNRIRKQQTKSIQIETIHEVSENNNNENIKIRKCDIAPRSLTPTPYVYRKGSPKKHERRRTSSLPRIRFDFSEEDDTIKEEEDAELSSNSRDFKESSSICSKDFRATSRESLRTSSSRGYSRTPISSNLRMRVAVSPVKKTKKKKAKPTGDASFVQINDLYDKSIENLERMSLRGNFDSSFDDDDWLQSLVDMKIKQRETIKKHRGKYRVCSAWASKLISRHNIEVTTRIRQNDITRRAKNSNSNRFDMNKEKELFELTHKNLQDLMVKQINMSIAKKSENTVKQYVQNVGGGGK